MFVNIVVATCYFTSLLNSNSFQSNPQFNGSYHALLDGLLMFSGREWGIFLISVLLPSSDSAPLVIVMTNRVCHVPSTWDASALLPHTYLFAWLKSRYARLYETNPASQNLMHFADVFHCTNEKIFCP